jgi:hypothetical protein
MVGPLGESLAKALREGRLKPMTKADVDELRKSTAEMSDEDVERGLRRIQEIVDASDPDDWGV